MGIWRESGYADFADGSFGNGGQNIYVSCAGVLQRIFHFDVDGDGYMDLVLVNSQDHNERPPAYVIEDPLGSRKVTELPTVGAYAGAIGDLNGDGYDDLVLAHQNNGTHSDLMAFVYYGGPGGMSERHKVELSVPDGRAVAIGDFDGDGRPDLAFGSEGKLRIFYQTASGFAPEEHVDLDLEATHLAAGDLDGDGCAELYVRVRKEKPRVLWGGPGGIELNRYTLVGGPDPSSDDIPGTSQGWVTFAEGWRPKIVSLQGIPHLFRQEGALACFYPVFPERSLGVPLALDYPDVVSAAAGDVDGDGREDLVLAVGGKRGEPATSWVYWGRESGFDDGHRTGLPTTSARDVAVADLNGDGCAEVLICQGQTDDLHTTESLIYRGARTGLEPDPVRLTTHDATTVLVARTCDDAHPRIVFVNHVTGSSSGYIPVYVQLGGPDGFSAERRLELPAWDAVDSLCCDFDDDGWPDMMIGNSAERMTASDPGSYLYYGGPEGFRPERRVVFPTVRAHGSATGDFRRCGYLDIAVGGFYNPELRIFRGGGDGFDVRNPQRIILIPGEESYAIPTEYPPDPDPKIRDYGEPRWLLAADFDNDGWLDLFVSQIAGPRCLILWGGPEGFSLDRSTWLRAEGTACAQAADLTGNGYLDLILGGHQSPSKNWLYDSYIFIYWGGPEGFREDRRTQLPAHAVNSLTIADLNNDGILDIFGTSYNNGRDRDLDAYLYWGGPGGTYSAANHRRFFTHSSSGCLAADFNEDGWVDLAIANHKTYGNHVGLSHVWWNGPEGFSEKNVTRLPSLGPLGITSIDPGNIRDRSPEEYYVSSPFELPAGARVSTIRWQAKIPRKTWVRAQLRFAATKAGLEGARWQGPAGSSGWFDSDRAAGQMEQTGRWVQYRLALGAVNGGNSPRVTAVEVEFSA